MEPLERMFVNLDRWRHLPAYQLERRVDGVFGVYLAGLLAAWRGEPVRDVLIPELPLRKGTLAGGTDDNLSFKVDYAAFSADGSRVFLVELKTDMESRRGEQDAYLARAREVGFRAVVEGIVALARAGRQSRVAMRKYFALLRSLEALGFVTLPGDLERFVFAENRVGLTARLDEVVVAAREPAVELVYVQPVGGEEAANVIDFDFVAAHVGQFDDALSRRFAAYLGRWKTPAGALDGGPG